MTESAQLDIDATGAALTGTVADATTGAPIAGAEVSLWPIGAGESRPDQTLRTSAVGTFAARALREGRYRLLASKDGYGQEVHEAELRRGSASEVAFDLAPAEGLTVEVVDARDGRPLEAVMVVRDTSRHIVANRHSGVGADGALTIPLAAGRYLLSTSASGYGTATLPVSAPGRGLRVPLTPGGTLVIESLRDLRGHVRLVQADGEEYVRCWCNGIATLDLEGRRTTVENVTPGAYTAEIVDVLRARGLGCEAGGDRRRADRDAHGGVGLVAVVLALTAATTGAVAFAEPIDRRALVSRRDQVLDALDPEAMAAVVDPQLYRNRAARRRLVRPSRPTARSRATGAARAGRRRARCRRGRRPRPAAGAAPAARRPRPGAAAARSFSCCGIGLQVVELGPRPRPR